MGNLHTKKEFFLKKLALLKINFQVKYKRNCA